VEFNQGACDLLSRRRSELLGQRLDNFCASSSRPALISAWKQLQEGNPVTREIEIVLPTGEIRTGELTGTPDVFDGHLLIVHDITDQHNERAQFQYRALHDSLTDLANRDYFLERLNTALQYPNRRKQLAILFLDFDSFKLVNDSFGHQVGDQVLAAAATRVQAAVRPNDLVGRFGGDELIILCELEDGERSVVQITKRIIHALEQPFNIAKHQIYLAPSIGVALAKNERDADPLIQHADEAMYEAKKQGGNGYVLYGT